MGIARWKQSMALHGMVGHLLKFSRFQRAWLTEQVFIHRYHADVVQIAGGAHLAGFSGAHAH